MWWGLGGTKSLVEEPQTLEEKFSLPYLRSLYTRLLENKTVNSSNQAMVIETLRVLSELTVFGDNNNQLLFDFFCEKNMIALFLEIMRPGGIGPNGKPLPASSYTHAAAAASLPSCPIPVMIQILQTMGILCQCVKNETSLYYILSNNYINEFLRYPYDFDNDELLDQFVSFLKSLSLRMNENTIQFFFREEDTSIPLLNRAIELLRYREGMVRIAAQTSILNIYRVHDERARAISLQDDVMHSLFSQIVIILEVHYSSAVMCCLEYSANLHHPSSKDKTESKACKRVEDQLGDILTSLEDWLFYLQDIFGLNIEKLHTALVQYLVSNFIYPVLLDPLLRFVQDPRDEMQQTSPSKVVKSAKDSEEMLVFSIGVSLYFLNQILLVLSDTSTKRAVAVALFHPLSRKTRKRILATLDKKIEIARAASEKASPVLSSSSSLAIRDEVVEGSMEVVKTDLETENSTTAASASFDVSSVSGSPETKEEFIESHQKKSKRSKSSSNSSSGNANSPYRPKIDLDNTGSEEPYVDGFVQIENRNMYREGYFKILRTNFGSGLGGRLPLLAILLLQNIVNANFCRSKSGMNDEGSETMNRTTDAKEEIPSYLKDALMALAIWPRDTTPSRVAQGDADHNVFTALSSLLNTITCSGTAEVNPDELSQCNEETGKYDPDILSVRRLLLMTSEVPLTHNERMGGIDDVWSPLVYSLCSLIVDQGKSPLVSLQAAVNCMFSLVRVYMIKNIANPTLPIATVEDIAKKDRFCFKASRHAVKLSADTILTRLEGCSGDIVMSSFQEELKRTFGLKWSEVSVKLMKDCILLLPPVQSVNLRIGLEFGMPISLVEATRREVQVFLLMRGLYKQIYKLLFENDNSRSTMDDVSLGIMDEDISQLSEFGCLDPDYSDFKEINLSEKVAYPVVLSSTSSSESKVLNTTPERRRWNAEATAAALATPTSPAVVPVGHIQGHVSVVRKETDDKWQENLHLVLNDYAFLIVSRDPTDNDKGTIRMVCPIHQTDVSISSERRNILKVLVRCSDQLPLMERIGVTNDNPETMGTGMYGKNHGSSFSMTSQGVQRGICLLQARQPNVLWRASMWFDNDKDCETTSQHVELRRIQVRHEKLVKLKGVLEFWSNPDNLAPCDGYEYKEEEEGED